jgi:hypothetical protein
MTALGRPALASPYAGPVTFNYLIFLNFLILPKKFDLARLLLSVGQRGTSGSKVPTYFRGEAPLRVYGSLTC